MRDHSLLIQEEEEDDEKSSSKNHPLIQNHNHHQTKLHKVAEGLPPKRQELTAKEGAKEEDL